MERIGIYDARSKLSELIELRCSGQRRRGRRPDADVSLATLRVLNPRVLVTDVPLDRARLRVGRPGRQTVHSRCRLPAVRVPRRARPVRVKAGG